MHYVPSSIDDAIDRGFDPREPIAAPTQADTEAFEASPWRTALDASVAQAKRLQSTGPVALTADEKRWLDAEAEHERAQRDREWWSE